jgi:hypothetical protein
MRCSHGSRGWWLQDRGLAMGGLGTVFPQAAPTNQRGGQLLARLKPGLHFPVATIYDLWLDWP